MVQVVSMKNATLSISRKLAAQLNAVPGIKTRMTRNADYFVNLNRRVAIARENEALVYLYSRGWAHTFLNHGGGFRCFVEYSTRQYRDLALDRE